MHLLYITWKGNHWNIILNFLTLEPKHLTWNVTCLCRMQGNSGSIWSTRHCFSSELYPSPRWGQGREMRIRDWSPHEHPRYFNAERELSAVRWGTVSFACTLSRFWIVVHRPEFSGISLCEPARDPPWFTRCLYLFIFRMFSAYRNDLWLALTDSC